MRHIVLALMASLMACAAHAQTAELPSAADAQAVSCMQRGTGKLRYPASDLEARTPGTVRVSLRFTAPDRRPEVKVIFRAASDAMVSEVEDLVRDYRVPCLSGAPVTAVQEFVFTPRVTDPITWTPPRAVRDTDDSPERASCMRTPAAAPDFAGGFLQRGIANVFVDMTFTAPDAPPDVTLAYSNAGKWQEEEVRSYVARYRLPCLAVGAKPLAVRQQFQFRPYGVGKRVFKDAVPLGSFLSNMKGIREQRVEFDLNTMSCPFQVAWTLGKPALDNRVGEVGKPDLNRTEFLAWLADLQMDLKEASFQQLLGETVIVSVPCGRLSLAPQP